MAVTRTLGPLHFEDLEPHRFEDLVRELIYDFKDWQSIEATGRGGGDDGFDIRAYERASQPDSEQGEGEPGEDDLQMHPMEGNLWMFQCKREAEIGPTRAARIIDEGVKAADPPYGYVLVAPANFSKKSFDVFREELRKRGVMEFYLWGRAALEDMLHLPKNDRVLFTFFGISLVSRRKSRATEIRAIVSRKNKLIRILGEQPRHQPVLVRDTKDTHYPYSDNYKDFERSPRWRAFDVLSLHPLGLVVSVHEYFAYWDKNKGEWDMTSALNVAMQRNENEDEEERRSKQELREKIEAFWHFIPHSMRAMFVRNGLIRFDEIAVIDEKGDSEFNFPHIYVDFRGKNGPFHGFYEYLKINEHHHEHLEGLKRIKLFPQEFEPPRIGTVHRGKALKIADRARELLRHGSQYLDTLYSVDGAFDFLEEADVIGIEGTQDKVSGTGGPTLIQITNKSKIAGKAFLAGLKDDPGLKHRVQEQIGREVAEKDQLRIVEFKVVYAWAIERLEKAAKRSS